MNNIYLAGPMRGIPEFNFPLFYKVADKLRQKGFNVFNPAERDELIHGKHMSETNKTGDVTIAEKEHGFSLRAALAADTEWICKHADAIALLPGWYRSKGATAELALSQALGHKVFFLTEEGEILE